MAKKTKKAPKKKVVLAPKAAQASATQAPMMKCGGKVKKKK